MAAGEYSGEILRVDLTNRKLERFTVPEEIPRSSMGGIDSLLRSMPFLRSGKGARRNMTPFLFLLPLIVVEFSIIIFPLFTILRMSFQSYFLLEPQKVGTWVGLQNYWRVFVDNLNAPLTFLSLRNSIFWSFANTTFRFVLGMAVAVLLNRSIFERLKLTGLTRVLILTSWITPGVAGMTIWRLVYQSTNLGLLNGILVRLGILSGPVAWLENPSVIWLSCIVASAWKGFPYVAIALTAAMATISRHYYDSAAVDGATGFRKFWHITFPLILPVAIPVYVMELMWTFNNFLQIYVLTRGGPADSTMVLPIQVFKYAFEFDELGMASALGAFMLVVALASIYLQQRYLRY